jgi:putative aldouronate transport system permease protein
MSKTEKTGVRKKGYFRRELPFHIMLIPGIVLTLVFSYYPMIGIVMAFQKYNPALGFFRSKWVGWKNFQYIFKMDDFYTVLSNSLIISLLKIGIGLIVPLILSLLLNELSGMRLKKFMQTSLFLPYFLAWTLLGGLVLEIFSLDGIINSFIGLFGKEPVYFMVKKEWFRTILISTDVWKNMGYSIVIFLASITNINPTLYEAACIDGATRWKQVKHVTLPGMLPIIILVATLSIGSILDAGFEQVLVLYNPLVYETGDIIDTFVYRMGLLSNQFSPAAAVGLFKSLVSFLLVSISYVLAYKVSNYRIF